MQGSLFVTILHFLLSCYSGLFFKQKYITMYSYRERQTTTRNICLVTPLNITIRHSNSVPVHLFNIQDTKSTNQAQVQQLGTPIQYNTSVWYTVSVHPISIFIRSIYFALHLVHLFCTPIQFRTNIFGTLLNTIMQYQYSVRLLCTIRRFVTPIHYIYLVNLFVA